jgi:hypothetical protein
MSALRTRLAPSSRVVSPQENAGSRIRETGLPAARSNLWSGLEMTLLLQGSELKKRILKGLAEIKWNEH